MMPKQAGPKILAPGNREVGRMFPVSVDADLPMGMISKTAGKILGFPELGGRYGRPHRLMLTSVQAEKFRLRSQKFRAEVNDQVMNGGELRND